MTIEKLRYLEKICKDNIAFVEQRLKIQADPSYDRFAKSGGQWGENQYNQLQISNEQKKLLIIRAKIQEVLENSEWVCTDPDNDQWRLNDSNDQILGKVFNFREGGIEEEIDIRNYSDDQKISVVSSYGYHYNIGSGKLTDCNGDLLGNAILAECIFEDSI